MMPVGSLYNSTYHTLRSGGRTFLTFLFDSFYSAAISLPIAFVLSRFTDLNILMVFLCVQLADIPKVIFGLTLVSKRIWVRNLVGAAE